MQTLSLFWGIFAVLGMFVGSLPFLGALNWVNIPFAALGLVISIVAYSKGLPNQGKGKALAGIICCAVAAVLGFFRLTAGGGIF